MNADLNSRIQRKLNKNKKSKNMKRLLLVLSLVAVIVTSTVLANPASALAEDVSDEVVQGLESGGNSGSGAQDPVEAADEQTNAQGNEAAPSSDPQETPAAPSADQGVMNANSVSAVDSAAVTENGTGDGGIAVSGAEADETEKSADQISAAEGSGTAEQGATLAEAAETVSTEEAAAEKTTEKTEQAAQSETDVLSFADDRAQVKIARKDGAGFPSDTTMSGSPLGTDDWNRVLSAVSSKVKAQSDDSTAYSVAGLHTWKLSLQAGDGSAASYDDIRAEAEFQGGLNDAGYAAKTSEKEENGTDGTSITTASYETSWRVYAISGDSIADPVEDHLTDLTDADGTSLSVDENGALQSAAFDGSLPETVVFAQIVRETVTTGTEKKKEIPMPAVTFDKEAATDHGTITVHVEADEGTFEQGTTMSVKQVSSQDILDKAIEAAGGRGSAAAVDISFRKADGTETEPAKPIRVKMTAKVLGQADKVHVVHVDDTGSTDVVARKSDGKTIESTSGKAASSDAKNAVSFESDSFSVYAIVYTVDFEYSVNGKMYQFSLPGGGFVSFTDLVELLGIIGDTNSGENGDENGSVITENSEENAANEAIEEDGINSDTNTTLTLGDVEVSEATRKFVADVTSVEFSSPELVDVSKVENETTVGQIKESRGLECENSAELTEEQIAEINAQTVKAGDWALISVQPFVSEETLTVTMKDGEVFSIHVTDAQIKKTVIDARGDTWEITVTYNDEAEIPEDAELRVREILPEDEEYEEYYQRSLEKVGVVAVPDTTEDEQASEVNDEDTAAETTSEENSVSTYAHIFDIQIWDDDHEIQPAADVSVSIKLLDAPEEDTDLRVVHFSKDGLEEMELTGDGEETGEQAEGVELCFVTNEFSVYSIIGTVIEKNVLASDGRNYRITVTYGPEAGIPKNAELSVEEILPEEMSDSGDDEIMSSVYEEYVSKTENTLGLEEGTAEYIRLFDISIVDKDNHEKKYQPKEGSSVAVRVELADKKIELLNVVHFADGADDGEIVESVTENVEDRSTVEFETDSFSVYSIVEAPEPVSVYENVSTLDELEENQEYYLSIVRSGTKYMTSTRVLNGVTYELSGVTDRISGGKWFFEFPEEGKVNIYYLDQESTKMYLNVDTSRNIRFSESPQALSIEPTINAAGTFYIYTVIANKNYALSVRANKNFFFEQRNNGADANERVIITKYMNDPYDLDGKTFGIAYNDNSVTAAAMTAERAGNQNKLLGLDMFIRNDVLNNNGNLLVAENSDIQEWTFVSAGADNYYIKTTVDGAEKYLRINNANVTLVDDAASASAIQATPGTNANSGKWHFTVGNYSLNYAGSPANGFNAANNSNASTWLNLVEKSNLTDDDFVEYTARKISASDDILSATEKDEDGHIKHDDDGNVVYREKKAQVVIYTRVWNETTKKYEFYAMDHDGSLIRVYDSGDQINWIGNQVNSALWEFTEYTNDDGTPTYYYELENTAYAGTYLAPQSDGIISRQPVGVNLNGRREGFDYSSIVAWDDPAYAYSGLKIVQDENGTLRAVTCLLDEADDFHFAVITPPVEEADPTTTVDTVDNNEFGISIKMIDFNNAIVGDRDTVQTSYLGSHKWDAAHAYEAETGLVSTNLTGGYPIVTAHTEKEGSSLSGLFSNMTPANQLFIQSVYNESGYFEYDSTQNFAHLNEDGTFTVYNQLGAIGTNTGTTRAHGQFMPYNDISAETGYAHDSHGNVITNKYNIRGQELPDTDPRKGEPLYSIPQNDADYFFGMELSAVFTQTPDGVDNWGHDIIFEFTGDDDFWFYVDGELVLDLGGVHSALGGSVNFRTGEVISNGTRTTLYDVFKSNYQARGLDVSAVDDLFVTKTVNGETVHVFNDYSKHEMKVFYMERGGGASNLKMRFNLASVKPGTVELSKQLKGIDNATNKLIQYPYQIWYQTAEYKQNDDGTYVLDENGHRVISSYHEPELLSQRAVNTDLTGRVYAVYKGTKTLIPYKDSMTIGGITYNNVFLLRAGETAVINFPENTYQYKIVECGVDTAVYEHVYINGGQNEIFGKPYNNTDGRSGGQDTPPEHTTTYEGTTRSDFGVRYDSTEGRPRVEYTNEIPPEVMRTLSFQKVLYDTNGDRLTDEQAAQVEDAFTFRLYLGNEFADQETLLPADMYTYYIKGPDQNYYRWDKAGQKFVSLGVDTFEEFKNLSKAEQDAGTFTTSIYGSISKIPVGYTVEVRDLVVGTKYKIDEPDREIPKGYTRRDSDGYVRTDLPGGKVVYYTDEEGHYGRHPEEGNKITAEPISDTIADKTESPNIEIRNQEGWGLTAQKEWTDKDFMIHDPVYLAVYLVDGTGNPGALIEGTVRKLNTNETEVYWFFEDLKIGGEPYAFDQFIVREVKLTGTPAVDENGVVTGYSGITPIDEGGSISVRGRTYSGTERTESYTVNYMKGQSTGQNVNIRTDTVTNSRPGIQIFKTDWNGEKYLSGAVFILKDSDGHDVGHATYTSDRIGLVTTAYLNEGTFTLNEIKTPAGYTVLDEPITITVATEKPDSYDLTVISGSTTYYITLNGPSDFYTATPATESDMARITVKNRTVQELKVVKVGVDGSTRTPLSDVHFALYDQVKDSEGHVRPAYSPKNGFEDLVTKEGGILQEITMSLGTGTYYLREKTAPSGYKKAAEDLCFTIGEDGTVVIQNVGYSGWLTRDTSVPGTVSYQISIENTPLGITFRKTDETGKGLSGSAFVLCIKNDAGSFETVTGIEGIGEGGLIDLTNKTEMTFKGLINGIYRLTETSAPSGYIILTKDIYFKVSDGAVTLTDIDGQTKTYSDVSLLDDNTTIVVKNTPGMALPSTGGPGTTALYFLGIMLTGIAGAGLVMRKRRRI